MIDSGLGIFDLNHLIRKAIIEAYVYSRYTELKRVSSPHAKPVALTQIKPLQCSDEKE